jgi:CRP-like cAMP-binding protein
MKSLRAQYDLPMRLRKDAKIELIKSVPLFSRCTKRELAAIAAETDELSPPEGTNLTKQGERGRDFIVIVEGSADVVKNGRKINRLGSGDFLGEIALISGAARTATVTTTSRTRLLVLTDRAFRRVTEQMPSIQTSVLKALSERLQDDAL